MKSASALRWIGRYGRISAGAGAHLLFRWLGFPRFDRIEALLPASGRILDAGCGHGLLAVMAAARGAGREVLGIDLLERRLDAGREVARRYGLDNVRFERRDIGAPPAGPFDAIVVADVLLYRPLQAQRDLLRQLSERLSPGGRLLLKEQVREPGWKAGLVRMQERMVVGAKVVLGRSRAWGRMAPSGVHLWDAGSLVDELRSLGLEPDSRRLDRWSYLSHRLFIAAAPRSRPVTHPPTAR
jgi:2-polyprenyl-3-methyl-5-hydroxy-6-metoxy-1,4-benzoquinol methylase